MSKNSDSVIKYHKKLLSLGLCIRCRNPRGDSVRFCVSCKKKEKERRGLVEADALRGGMCKMCLSNKICNRSKSYCEHCLDLRRSANRKYNQSHKKENYQRTLEWNKKNPVKSKQHRKKYAESHKEKVKELNRAYKKTKKYQEQQREYRRNNREHINKCSSDWQKENKERRNKYVKEWMSRNPDKQPIYSRTYQLKHPEKSIGSSKKRREIFKSIKGSFNLHEWNDLVSKTGNKCLRCGKNGVKLTIDHVVPITEGGTHYISNIQPLCRRCNSIKGNKTIDFRPPELRMDTNIENLPL